MFYMLAWQNSFSQLFVLENKIKALLRLPPAEHTAVGFNALVIVSDKGNPEATSQQ